VWHRVLKNAGQKVASFRISDTGDNGCSEFQLYSQNFPIMGVFSPKFCIFGQTFSDKEKILQQP